MVAIVVNGQARSRSRVGMVLAELGNDYANRHEGPLCWRERATVTIIEEKGGIESRQSSQVLTVEFLHELLSKRTEIPKIYNLPLCWEARKFEDVLASKVTTLVHKVR